MTRRRTQLLSFRRWVCVWGGGMVQSNVVLPLWVRVPYMIANCVVTKIHGITANRHSSGGLYDVPMYSTFSVRCMRENIFIVIAYLR